MEDNEGIYSNACAGKFFYNAPSTDATGDVDAHNVDDTNANKDVSSLQGIYHYV